MNAGDPGCLITADVSGAKAVRAGTDPAAWSGYISAGR
jgi:hypothetical protein